MKKITLLILICLTYLASHAQSEYNILKYGAIADGKTLNTKAIQKAIDAAAFAGGGTVLIPPGIFVSGTIVLKDNINLEIQAGSTLLGSPNIDDYLEFMWGHNIDRQPYHLIFARNCKNISITGKGTINGNGESFWEPYEKDIKGNMITPRWISPKKKKVSPLIELMESQNITVKDITIKTGGGWNLHLLDCDIAKIDGVNIENSVFRPNSDGIDLTGSRDVLISCQNH